MGFEQNRNWSLLRACSPQTWREEVGRKGQRLGALGRPATPRPEPTLRPALDFGHVPTPAPPALRVGTSSRWWQRWVGTAGLQAASWQTLPTAGPSPAALELGDVLVPLLDPAQ